jgi:hypothetical protein
MPTQKEPGQSGLAMPAKLRSKRNLLRLKALCPVSRSVAE